MHDRDSYSRNDRIRQPQNPSDPNSESFRRASMQNQYQGGRGRNQAFNRNEGYMEDVQRNSDSPRLGGWGDYIGEPSRRRGGPVDYGHNAARRYDEGYDRPLGERGMDQDYRDFMQDYDYSDHNRNQAIGAYNDNRSGHGSAHHSELGMTYGTSMPDYTGRGPKGWERTDQRILEDICERLSDDRHVDASDVEVSCDKGVVTLEGEVDSRPNKHRIEDIVAACRGVKDIHNRIRVHSSSGGGFSRAMATIKDKLTPGSSH